MAYAAKNEAKHGVYIIPSEVYDSNTKEWLKINEMPDFTVFTDTELARVLGVSLNTIRTWVFKNIIPFKQHGRYREFHIPEVITALKVAGYAQKR